MGFMVSAQTRSNRLQICKKCEHYVESTRSCGTLILGEDVVVGTERKKLCGCVMTIKTRLKTAQCPIDKWGAIITPELIAKITELLEGITDRLSKEQHEELLKFYNLSTGENRQASNCKSCVRGMIDDMRNLIQNDTEKN